MYFAIYTRGMVTVIPAPITLEQFAKLPEGARHEIDAGVLITLPPAKSLQSRIAGLFSSPFKRISTKPFVTKRFPKPVTSLLKIR